MCGISLQLTVAALAAVAAAAAFLMNFLRRQVLASAARLQVPLQAHIRCQIRLAKVCAGHREQLQRVAVSLLRVAL